MIRPMLLTLCICCLSATAPAEAEEVTLENCVQRALRHNSGLKAYGMSTEAAQSDKRISRTSFFPILSLKALYYLADKPERFVVARDSVSPGYPAQDVNLADHYRDRYQAGVVLTQPLFTGGNLLHRYARSDFQLLAAQNELDYQQSVVVEQVTRTFFALLAAKVQVQAQSKLVEARKHLLRIVKARRDEGYVTPKEVLQAESALSEAEACLMEAQQQAALVHTTLRNLLQLPEEQVLEPCGELQKITIERPLHDFMTGAVARRRDVSSRAYTVKQKEEEVGIARSGYYPTITLQGGYLRQRDTYITHPDVWSVTVNAEWNLFEWGRTQATVQRAVAVSQHDALQLDELKKNVTFEVEQLWRQAQTEQSQLVSLELRLKTAEYALEQTLDRWREGKSRQVDLSVSEAEVWQVYAEYCQHAALLEGVGAALARATAQPMQQWATRTPLYHPDFIAIAARIQADAQRGGEVSGRAAGGHPMPVLGQSSGHATSAPAGRASNLVYRLQLGAFVRKSNAEQLVDQVRARYGTRISFIITGNTGLYRVVSSPYATREAALHEVTSLGITEYLLRTERSSAHDTIP